MLDHSEDIVDKIKQLSRRYFSLLNYDIPKIENAANHGVNTLTEWNRIVAGGKKCNYYINGKSVAELHSYQAFSSIDELKVFFKQTLLRDIQQPEQDRLAERAILHFNHAIQHATFYAALERGQRLSIFLTDPSDKKIQFNSHPSGIFISEKNPIRGWRDSKGFLTECPIDQEDFATTETTYLLTGEASDDFLYTLDLNVQCREPKLLPVFQPFIQHPSEHKILQAIHTKLQPTLYFPQTQAQQDCIIDNQRNCFYVDYANQRLFYINRMGTRQDAMSWALLTKTIEDAGIKGRQATLQLNTEQGELKEWVVPQHYTPELGYGLTLNELIIETMIPKQYPRDLFPKHGEIFLKKLHDHEQSMASYIPRLFDSYNQTFLQQQRMQLAVLQQFVNKNPAAVIRKYHEKPPYSDFWGQGENVYVFVEDLDWPERSCFWYVDRSETIPQWTPFPIQKKQSEQLRAIFDGAEHDNDVLSSSDDHLKTLFDLGAEKTERIDNNPQYTALRMQTAAQRGVLQVLLEDTHDGQVLMDDCYYYDAFDTLTNTLMVRTSNDNNHNKLLDRCFFIQQKLSYFTENFDRHFPQSRGFIPYEKRTQMLEMLNTIATDPTSSKAKQYFRVEHRVYREDGLFCSDGELNDYEASSFVWSGVGTEREALWYINEAHTAVQVTLNKDITQALQICTDKGNSCLSAAEVYRLMTRPHLFYYAYGIPIGLNYKSISFFKGFDRSQGLHTGTAQEMMCELHDMHLSTRAFLCQLLKVIMWAHFPSFLQNFGIHFPFAWVCVSVVQVILSNLIYAVWGLSVFFNLFHWVGVCHLMVRPGFNELDKALKELAQQLQSFEKNYPEERAPNPGRLISDEEEPEQNGSLLHFL